MNHFNQKYKKNKHVTQKTLDLLMAYAWPGNVRELANVMERLSVVTDKMQIDPEDLPHEIRGDALGSEIDRDVPLKQYLEEKEIAYIRRAVKKFGSARKAAVALKVDHSTLTRKLQRYERGQAGS
jgi:transcriptional regulator with PAS, ATPase and Fis domain